MKRIPLSVFALLVMAASVLSASPAAANATYTCMGEDATIVGTDDADRLVGTAERDVIVGLGGDDDIQGLGKDDIICGGSGNDTISGGSGPDQINGGKGNDQINGGKGNDTIQGNDGKDVLKGSEGADHIRGGDQSDSISGGSGPDQISGGKGNDSISGGGGADHIRGGKGNDDLKGGQGKDELWGNNGADVLYGGPDQDTLNGLTNTDSIVESSPVSLSNNSQPTGPACNQVSLHEAFEDTAPTQNAQAQLLALLNEARAACNLPPLSLDPTLTQWALNYSTQMQTERNQGSTNWWKHSTKWQDAIHVLNYSSAGENLGFTTGSNQVVIHRGLVASGGHLCNILSPRYDVVGIGVTSLSSSGTGHLATFMFAGDATPATNSLFDGNVVVNLGSNSTPHQCG